MTLPLQKFRELVFQLLFAHSVQAQDEREIRELMMRELATTKRNVRDAQLRVAEIAAKMPVLDRLIREVATAYELERIQAVERNCLRLGLYEMLYDDAIPAKVAITEAMRLVRKFSTAEAARFVNAVMDAVYQRSLGEGIECAFEPAAAGALVSAVDF
ncbi:MAG: transcription antitermination factor NusB [Chlamydiia bacterium]|nr:transcription antitermination factor NusB [Chlamydiia bacterium]